MHTHTCAYTQIHACMHACVCTVCLVFPLFDWQPILICLRLRNLTTWHNRIDRIGTRLQSICSHKFFKAVQATAQWIKRVKKQNTVKECSGNGFLICEWSISKNHTLEVSPRDNSLSLHWVSFSLSSSLHSYNTAGWKSSFWMLNFKTFCHSYRDKKNNNW